MHFFCLYTIGLYIHIAVHIYMYRFVRIQSVYICTLNCTYMCLNIVCLQKIIGFCLQKVYICAMAICIQTVYICAFEHIYVLYDDKYA